MKSNTNVSNSINPSIELPHLLKYYLQASDSSKQFEIYKIPLQTGDMAEIQNIAGHLKKFQPDLVLLSPGYQEFSQQSIARNVISKNHFLNNILNKSELISYLHSKISDKSGYNPADADIREEILNQFESKLDQTLASLEKHNIPVILFNTASNLLDQLPANSKNRIEGDRLHLIQEEGISCYRKGEIDQAALLLNQVLKKRPDNAQCNYYLGKIAYLSQNYDMANHFLEKAKDMDIAGTRPPSEINRIIFKIAITRGCPLIETDKLLAQQAFHHIIGTSLISGPTDKRMISNVLLAKACLHTIVEKNIFKLPLNYQVSLPPLTPFDTLYDEIICQSNNQENPEYLNSNFLNPAITSDIPELAIKFSENKISWEDSMNLLYNKYTKEKNYQLAFKVIQNMILENPYDQHLINKASQTASMLGDSQMVVHFAQLSYQIHPNLPMASLLFINYLKLDQPEQALPYLLYAKKNYKNPESLKLILQSTCQVIDLKKLLQKTPDSKTLHQQIASEYLAMGNNELATRYLNNRSYPN